MKKFSTIILALIMVLSTVLVFSSCGSTTELTKENIKIGMLTLHDDSSTYDKNFIDAMYTAMDEMGIPRDNLFLFTGVDETENCYNKAKECVTSGCSVVFADSFGHEDFVIQAAQEFPTVRFCHATGTKAHSLNLDNYSNAFAAIYEGRYISGVAAGMKLNEMIANGVIKEDEAIVGYIGAYTYAEVISGYTSFFLGVKSVCPTATMKVRFTGSWYDTDKEFAAATALIQDDKCVIISQHADSYGAPNACEQLNVPNISYNGSTEAQGPNTYVISSKINWVPYFKYMITCTLEGKTIDKDYVGTIADGSVVMLPASKNAAAGTDEAVASLIEKFNKGEIKVFDTTTFTVEGKALDSYKADVNFDSNYEPDTEVISNGVFEESKHRSAPYFDLHIDGITLINSAY